MKLVMQELAGVQRLGTGQTVPIIGRFSWWTHDAWAIDISFHAIPDCRCDVAEQWMICRELLRDGCRRPVGEGDIRVGCAWGSKVLIAHRPPGKTHVLVEFNKRDVMAFLERTFVQVPLGYELSMIPFDAQLAAWLA